MRGVVRKANRGMVGRGCNWMTYDLTSLLEAEPFLGFYRAWQQARDGEGLPRKAQISSLAFALFAENMSICRRRNERDFQHLFSGSLVEERLQGTIGRETNILDLFAEDCIDRVADWLNTVFDRRCGGLGDCSAAYPNGAHKGFQIMALPIIAEDGDVVLLLCHHVLETIRRGEPRNNVCLGTDYFNVQFVELDAGAA